MDSFHSSIHLHIIWVVINIYWCSQSIPSPNQFPKNLSSSSFSGFCSFAVKHPLGWGGAPWCFTIQCIHTIYALLPFPLAALPWSVQFVWLFSHFWCINCFIHNGRRWEDCWGHWADGKHVYTSCNDTSTHHWVVSLWLYMPGHQNVCLHHKDRPTTSS